MTMLIYPYLLATLVTVAVLLTAIWAFIVLRERARRIDVLEQRLPKACWYEHLQELIRKAKADWDGLRASLANAEATIAKAGALADEIKDAKMQLESLQAERGLQEQLRAELAEVQRRLAEQTEQQRALQKEVDAVEFRVHKLRTEEADLSAKLAAEHKALEAAKKESDALQRQLAQRRVENAELEKKILANMETEEKLENRLKQLQQQLDEDRKKLEAVRTEYSRLAGEVEGLKQLKIQLEKIIARLDQHVQDLRRATGETTDDDASVSDSLWRPLLQSSAFRQPRERSEEQCLETTAEYISQLGLVFPKRVLYAFHTSLKIADISPLVVLAGISGTGKSLLPRRYAEGMGMYFLNLAVQPRWDSPQDLFGFYDYLGRRYRATELARALVQMDPFYDEERRGWPAAKDRPKDWLSLSDRMLLVLLDEMNLARIEYYFSEFLSRLEIRRDVRGPDPLKRRVAEVPLEIGPRRADGSSLYLFTDTNVLFAGTMNEDETTQSLSDKVVDRANVLRFGKPRSLGEDRSAQPVPATDRWLPHKVWQSWVKTSYEIPGGLDGAVAQWIERLNGAMAKVGRPFAFRTSLAMRLYAANYPQADDEGVRWAMADQIEQKILPKLRGLDLKEIRPALDDVKRVLEELGDNTLVRALDNCCRADQFLWLGLDRSED